MTEQRSGKTEKRKHLLDLEGNIANSIPLGKPKLIQVSGYDYGIDYIYAIGSHDGLHGDDREKLGYAVLHLIAKEAPIEADAFCRSDIESTEATYGWHGAFAVQYYMKNKTDLGEEK